MNWFKRTMVVGAVAAAMAFSGCRPEGNASASRASGSVALSNDDSTVFAVDTDNGVLAVINADTKEVRTVKVGEQPARVLVDTNDTVFVSNRGSRSVSVIRKGDTAESARIQVGVEPTGMALTPDGKTLLVVSATSLERPDVGTLTAVDVNTLEKQWELEVGEEPRAVAVIAGNRALVSLYKQGELVEVDLATGTTISSRSGIYDRANATRLDTSGVGGGFGAGATSTFRPRAMNDLVVTNDGTRVFAPVVWAREDAIGRQPSRFGGYYAAGGPCNIGAVATAGIVTVDTGSQPQPQVDDLTSCFTTGTNSGQKNFPASTLASQSGSPDDAIQGPTAGVLDPSGQWLMVLSRESKNIAFMPAYKRTGTNIDFDTTGTSIRTVQKVSGAGADGIAISSDFKRAYVYSQFDHKLEIFKGEGTGASSTIVPEATVQVAQDLPTFTPSQIEGRKLFFDAKDVRMSSSQTTVACSTCHLEGREDGHVWNFPDGARQTPSLAGRKLLATAPFHWSGEFGTIDDFNAHTIIERMGGEGLDSITAAKLDAFIDTMPLPENPLRTAMANTEQLAKGKAAYEKAQCGTCHNGEAMTNNTNADVGTLRLNGTNPDNGVVTRQGFNVPSLLGIGRTAPYLHDGSSLTLEARVTNGDSMHGDTRSLDAEEKSALVAYLKSL
ncbi:MAG: hypothetical protein ACO1OB_04540 [Archangium sp.]